MNDLRQLEAARRFPAIRAGHQSAEAFNLMWYECKDFFNCRHRERIWNSRDGVTPFGMQCPSCGGDMYHVEWEKDKYAPDHKPKTGQRIWVNLTQEKALQYAKKRLESIKPKYRTEKHLEEVASYIYGDGNQPDLEIFGYEQKL